MVNLHIDFFAPIIPGKSAGGFELGMKRNQINGNVLLLFKEEQVKNLFIKDVSITKYVSNDLILFFTNGILDQIGIIGSYSGKLKSGLGLGNYVHEFEKIYGPITEGKEDELIFSNLEGLCFETEEDPEINSNNWKYYIPTLPVNEIFIFNEKLTTSILLDKSRIN